MKTHISQVIGEPDLLQLQPRMYVARFETMKALSARRALLHHLEAGTIAPGDTVIDSSSGIYAHALAMACHEFCLNCVIVGSTTVDATLRAQLEILGVQLEQMPPSQSLKMDQNRRVSRIQELLEEHPTWHWMRQYHSPEHYLGYRDIAENVADQLQRDGARAVTLVAPVGSGASSGAFALGLKARGLDATVCGVQPFGSVTFGSEAVEDPDMLIAGIGSSIEFENVRRELYDRMHWVSFEVGRAGAVSLLRDHAIFAGLSSGAAYAAATYEQAVGANSPAARESVVLFLAPDTGHRYAESVFEGAGEVRPVQEYVGEVHVGDLALPWTVGDGPFSGPSSRS